MFAKTLVFASLALVLVTVPAALAAAPDVSLPVAPGTAPHAVLVPTLAVTKAIPQVVTEPAPTVNVPVSVVLVPSPSIVPAAKPFVTQFECSGNGVVGEQFCATMYTVASLLPFGFR